MTASQQIMSPSTSLPFANIYSRFISNLEEELDTSELSSNESVSNGLPRQNQIEVEQPRRSSYSCTSSTSSDQQQPRANIRKSVSFDNIAIRHYNVTLGKHLCEHDYGPAVTLDWLYEDESRLALNDYENHRHTMRRDRDQLVAMSRTEREERLQAVGFDISKINKAASRRRSIEREQKMETLSVIYSVSNLTQYEEQVQEQKGQTDEDVPPEF